MRPERDWWLRVPGVLVDPAPVFDALRSIDRRDQDARQEPILLITILAGVAAVLATPVAGRLLDEPDFDVLLVAVWAFIAGSVYGLAAYLLAGAALYLGARGMGSLGSYRLARHVVAFSATPVALSLLVLMPVRLVAFGDDAFHRGGSDEGVTGDVVLALQLAFVAWSVGLLLLGVKTVHAWTWGRSAGALGLVALLLAALVALPAVV